MYQNLRDGSPRLDWLVCCALLGVAAFLMFYRLGVPSLWLDEVASPLAASHPVDYILELSSRLEEHPPFFYLLLKGIMAFGTSDAVVRLLPAVCGLGCVVMIAVVGRVLLDWPTGLLAAALWLAMPQNLWLARMARPYTMWQLAFVCSLYFLFRCRRAVRPGDLVGLLAANILMVASHYLSFPLMAAEAGCLAVMRSPRGGGPGWLILATYAGGAFCIVAAAWFFFIRHSQVPQEIAQNGDTLFTVAEALWHALAGTLYYFENQAVRLSWLVAISLGYVALFYREREIFRCLAVLVVVPLALLVAMGKSTGLYERHLSFLSVPFCLALAGGATRFPAVRSRRGWIVGGILALTAVNALSWRHDDFYAITSYQVPVIGNNYKMTADALAKRYGPGVIFSYSNDFFGNAVSWYLARKPRPNPVGDQRLTEADAVAHVWYVASTHHGYLAWSGRAFLERFGPTVKTDMVDATSLYGLDVPRDPVRRIESLPAQVGQSMEYREFFATIGVCQGVRHHQNARGPAVVPTQNDMDATMRMLIENQAPPESQTIFCNILYDNLGRDSRLTALVTFDDEPAAAYPLSTGYDAVHQRQLVLRREAPYKRLAIDVVMRCASLTPTLVGGNLETLRLRGVQAFFCPDRESVACRDVAERHFTASVLDNFLEERFFSTSDVTQEIHDDSLNNLINAGEEDQSVWTRLTPLDPGRPGLLRMNVVTDRPRLFFFPRVGLRSAVHVWAVDGGRRQELLFGIYNETDRWNPVSARYEMVVPPRYRGRPLTLEIELFGPWSQLWRLEDALFF